MLLVSIAKSYPNLSDGAKKYQQTFLAPLPGMDLKPPYLVIALRNANTGKAKQWFYANKDRNTIWENCSTAFLTKFFLIAKTNALRGRILSFQQQHDESIPKAWEHIQDYISECPHHGMENCYSCRLSTMG